jgi:protein-tyrosine kinase
MNQKPPIPSSSSLIERAAEVYGLREAMRGNLSPVEPIISVQEITAPPAVQTPAVPIAQVNAAPFVRRQPKKSAEIDLIALSEAGMIVPGAPPSPLSEEFRIVKRQLLINAFGGRNAPALEKGRLILTCSAQPNEGKTFCTVNLALSMATETDLEVLLIDADVAKPEILSTLGLPGGPGLMDALADQSLDAEDLIIGTNVPGLVVLPAGRQTNNDTELLASDRTPLLIERLISANPRRIILFDSAPALAASPASVLALHVGQVMLVVKADITTESDLREAMAMLEGNAKIQMILNAVTYRSSSKKFGYYYGFGEKS